MRTLIVSDLHVGSRDGSDLLRRPELREPLLAAAADADRLVLLGDVLELRHGPRREAVAAALDLFDDLGRALAGRELVVLAGNHDHALVEPWLAARGEHVAPAPLGSEQLLAAADASPALAALAERASAARVLCAYPGLWVRPDVYATHGHYLDCHLTVPTLERLGIGAMTRVMRKPASALSGTDDYEAVVGPLYEWMHAVAQHAPSNDTLNGQVTVRAWRALRPGRARRSIGARALGAAFPLGVSALNRAGLGPLRADISGDELRRAGLRAMGEVTRRLQVDARYVVFGHTHRAGPLPGDDPAEWRGPGGVRLMNSGCWTYDGWWVGRSSGESPYWPGGCIVVRDDDGPPVLERLLTDRSRVEIAPVAGVGLSR